MKRKRWKSVDVCPDADTGVRDKRRRKNKALPVTASLPADFRDSSDVGSTTGEVSQATPVLKVSAPTSIIGRLYADCEDGTSEQRPTSEPTVFQEDVVKDVEMDNTSTLRSQDTVIINPSWPETSKTALKPTITPMPSGYSDFEGSRELKESDSIDYVLTIPTVVSRPDADCENGTSEQRPTSEPTVFQEDVVKDVEMDNTSTLRSQDTVIVNPSRPETSKTALKPTITPMPSGYSDFEGSRELKESDSIDYVLTIPTVVSRPDADCENGTSEQRPTSEPTVFQEDVVKDVEMDNTSTLRSQDTVIINPSWPETSKTALKPTITPMPSGYSDFEGSRELKESDSIDYVLTIPTVVSRPDADCENGTSEQRPTSEPTVFQEDVVKDVEMDNTSTLRSQDTVIINPSWPETSKTALKPTITPMPSGYSDFEGSRELKESDSIDYVLTIPTVVSRPDNDESEETILNQTPASPLTGCPGDLNEVSDENTSENDSLTLCSQDTMIINPAWHDLSSDDLEPLPTLTPMPSVYSELETSFRTNESIMIHRNLTLLLATTRIAIAHDENDLRELDLDISRMKSGLHKKTTDFDRLSCRLLHVRKSLLTLCE